MARVYPVQSRPTLCRHHTITDTMDDEQARRRLLEGGYFVAMGVPPGIEFGIDLKSYQVIVLADRTFPVLQLVIRTTCPKSWRDAAITDLLIYEGITVTTRKRGLLSHIMCVVV